MGVTETFMGEGQFTVPIRRGAPLDVLRDISIKDWLWATIIITPHDFAPGSIAIADLLAMADFTGPVLEQGSDGSLMGDGPEWWLGNSGDGGGLAVGPDVTHTGKDFEGHLDDDVFGAADVIANGLTKGALIDGTATTFSFKEEAGDTPREILDTLTGIAGNTWRINPNLTVDADDQATLWPSTDEPTVLLSSRGGREGGFCGLHANLRVDGINGREVRTGVYVKWDDGTNNGVNTPTLPATYTTPTGDTPRVRTLIDWRPKRPKPPTERWRKVAAWRIASQAKANTIAAREANERASIRHEITAEVTERHPHRFDITPGNTVYLWAPRQDLVDTTNHVQYRGEVTHPTTGRIDSMDWPINKGRGVYMYRWVAGNAELVHLTPYVDFEEGPTVLQIGTRDRFPIARARARGLSPRDRRRIRNRSHQDARLDRFAHSGFFR